jgi:hypothetical protein
MADDVEQTGHQHAERFHRPDRREDPREHAVAQRDGDQHGPGGGQRIPDRLATTVPSSTLRGDAQSNSALTGACFSWNVASTSAAGWFSTSG